MALKVDKKKRYTIVQNIDDHIGYEGQKVQIIEIFEQDYFSVMDDRGNIWYCGEEELQEV